MYDDNGELLYMEGTLEDITERKLIQEQLKESEKKFRQIIGRHWWECTDRHLMGSYWNATRNVENDGL
jgi:PAS domain-containing protein